MRLADLLVKLGEDRFGQLIRGVSIGKLKTFRLYESFKASAHLNKLNTESLRKAVPRFWSRLNEGEEEFAKDLGQAVLVSHIDMIEAVLDFLGIPHEGGFFAKDVDAARHLTEGWQARVFEKFSGVYPEPVLLFYINHLGWEMGHVEDAFLPPQGDGS
jgi:hypothetical protein